MMRAQILSFISLVLISASLFAYPKGPQTFLFHQVQVCQEEKDEYYGAGQLLPKRINKQLVVTLNITLNCGVAVKDSDVFYRNNGVTLNIKTASPSGDLTICECPSKYEFTLLNEVKKGETIYLVVDGAVTAAAKAP